MSGWIGVDLDGTLAFYDCWRSPHHIGEPVPAMAARVKRWVAQGREVRIFTARVSGPPDEVKTFRGVLANWLHRHGLPDLAVTNAKDYGMVELWDDRAVQVIPNTGRRADEALEDAA